jgi:hypothetical protein
MKSRPLPRNERERLEVCVGGLLSNLRELVRALEETDDLQWKRPGEAGGMLPVGYTDPTGETVIDYRRLKLRGVRRDVLREIGDWEAASRRLLNRLDAATEPYEGSE